MATTATATQVRSASGSEVGGLRVLAVVMSLLLGPVSWPDDCTLGRWTSRREWLATNCRQARRTAAKAGWTQGSALHHVVRQVQQQPHQLRLAIRPGLLVDRPQLLAHRVVLRALLAGDLLQ